MDDLALPPGLQMCWAHLWAEGWNILNTFMQWINVLARLCALSDHWRIQWRDISPLTAHYLLTSQWADTCLPSLSTGTFVPGKGTETSSLSVKIFVMGSTSLHLAIVIVFGHMFWELKGFLHQNIHASKRRWIQAHSPRLSCTSAAFAIASQNQWLI